MYKAFGRHGLPEFIPSASGSQLSAYRQINLAASTNVMKQWVKAFIQGCDAQKLADFPIVNRKSHKTYGTRPDSLYCANSKCQVICGRNSVTVNNLQFCSEDCSQLQSNNSMEQLAGRAVAASALSSDLSQVVANCAARMREPEVDAISARGDDEKKFKYATGVRHMIEQELSTVSKFNGASVRTRQKLVAFAMYKAFDGWGFSKFLPDAAGSEAFAIEQIESAARTGILHSWVATVVKGEMFNAHTASVVGDATGVDGVVATPSAEVASAALYGGGSSSRAAGVAMEMDISDIATDVGGVVATPSAEVASQNFRPGR